MLSRKRQPTEKMRRHRTIVACSFCRAKKYKCDGNLPCINCRRKRIECIFQLTESGAGNVREYSIASVDELKRKLDAAETTIQRLQREQAKGRAANSTSNPPAQYNTTSYESIGTSETGQSKSPKSTPSGPCQEIVLLASEKSRPPDEANTITGDEHMEINTATKNFEFHGGTSVVTLFNGLRKEQQNRYSSSSEYWTRDSCETPRSLASDFHNGTFLGRSERPLEPIDASSQETYAYHAFLFIDAYFKSLHVIHPILDQPWFLSRCNDLWSGRLQRLRQSFMALYFSVLSLGACVRVWTEHSINGMSRLEWSRLLFEKAEHALGRSGAINDLEAVQAPFILSLVCQQQLELNLAYSFLGKAIRTAYSTGINRKVEFADPNFPQDSPTFTVARTWWGLYNLEMELSFTLGRPDGLGMESYHNRPLPPMDESENMIIPVMHDLSLILRQISTDIYLGRSSPEEKLERANQIELDLDQWLVNLPPIIRPPPGFCVEALQDTVNIRGPYWSNLQILILKIRYLYAKTILFSIFSLHLDKVSPKQRAPPEAIHAAAEKCRNSAQAMVNILHWEYRMHHSYQTWGFNTAYVTLGSLIFLSSLTREPSHVRKNSKYLEYINKSLEVLGAMEECSAAQRIGHFVKEFLTSLLSDGTEANQTQMGKSSQLVPNPLIGIGNFNVFLPGDFAEFEDYQVNYDHVSFLGQGLHDLEMFYK